MTKYVSSKGACRVSYWHSDPECSNLKVKAREATQAELDYHELDPCKRCVEGEEPSVHEQENWKYQNVEIDPENDPLDRIHE